jgi:hypothetical protein
MAGSCERGNEPAGCIRCLETVEQLSDCQLLKKALAPWSYAVEKHILNTLLQVKRNCKAI